MNIDFYYVPLFSLCRFNSHRFRISCLETRYRSVVVVLRKENISRTFSSVLLVSIERTVANRPSRSPLDETIGESGEAVR